MLGSCWWNSACLCVLWSYNKQWSNGIILSYTIYLLYTLPHGTPTWDNFRGDETRNHMNPVCWEWDGDLKSFEMHWHNLLYRDRSFLFPPIQKLLELNQVIWQTHKPNNRPWLIISFATLSGIKANKIKVSIVAVAKQSEHTQWESSETPQKCQRKWHMLAPTESKLNHILSCPFKHVPQQTASAAILNMLNRACKSTANSSVTCMLLRCKLGNAWRARNWWLDGLMALLDQLHLIFGVNMWNVPPKKNIETTIFNGEHDDKPHDILIHPILKRKKNKCWSQRNSLDRNTSIDVFSG